MNERRSLLIEYAQLLTLKQYLEVMDIEYDQYDILWDATEAELKDIHAQLSKYSH